MLTVGLSGGLDSINQRRDWLFPRGTFHDAAAVLVEDGRVVAAIEEERLNRIKHTNKGPVNALRFCLAHRGIRLQDVDAVAYYGSEELFTRMVEGVFHGNYEAAPVTTARGLLHGMIQESTGEALDDRKLVFVHHHLAHAIAAYVHSGLSHSLVLTLDGAGDALSGSLSVWQGSRYETLRHIPDTSSLGTLYDRAIALIGYGFAEEYKVMGLAPYGDPARYRAAFSRLYELGPEGCYQIVWDRFESLYPLVPLRKRGEPIRQEHTDLAAALQEALERIVLHILSYARAATGLSSLCLAGGVAHNCTMNGRILRSGLFQDVFVHPASYDAGCAIGAALAPQLTSLATAAQAAAPPATPAPATSPAALSLRAARRLDHVYWGTDIGTDDAIASQLRRWRDFIDVERDERIAARTAAALAAGQVGGWVQGRSEFGPRALGNRSIVADPRPAANKDRVNAMVKKREAYRPFAPAVLEEYVQQFFDVSSTDGRFSFMSFAVPVRLEHRETLGATTHVDGSSRLQTVSRASNPLFWELIDEFRKLTNVPVLLNTSFNNHAEPIVDSVDDAVVCFLTTGLEHLAVGSHFVTKKPAVEARLLQLCLMLSPSQRVVRTKAVNGRGTFAVSDALMSSYDDRAIAISAPMAELLFASSGSRTIADVIGATTDRAGIEALTHELLALWTARAIVLSPPM